MVSGHMLKLEYSICVIHTTLLVMHTASIQQYESRVAFEKSSMSMSLLETSKKCVCVCGGGGGDKKVH